MTGRAADTRVGTIEFSGYDMSWGTRVRSYEPVTGVGTMPPAGKTYGLYAICTYPGCEPRRKSPKNHPEPKGPTPPPALQSLWALQRVEVLPYSLIFNLSNYSYAGMPAGDRRTLGYEGTMWEGAGCQWLGYEGTI